MIQRLGRRFLLEIADFSVFHPRTVLIGALAAGVLAAWAVSGLKLETDIQDLLPREAPEIREYLEALEVHGEADQLYIILRGEGETDVGLRIWLAETIIERLEETGLVASVFYRLGTEVFEHLGSELAGQALLFLDPADLPQVKERLSDQAIRERMAHLVREEARPAALGEEAKLRLRKDPLGVLEILGERMSRTMRLPFRRHRGYFFTQDLRDQLVVVQPDGPARDTDFSRQFMAAVIQTVNLAREEVREWATDPERKALSQVELRCMGCGTPQVFVASGAPPPRIEVLFTGGYPIGLDYQCILSHDLWFTGIISFLAVMGLFLVSFRRLGVLLYAGIPLALGLTLTLAFAAIAVGNLNVFTAGCMAMVCGLGVDYGIHLYNRYLEEVHAGRDMVTAFRTTLAETGAGIAAASVTTAVAFFALTLARMKGIRQLGLICGVGMVLTLVTTLVLLPALVALVARVRPTRERERGMSGFGLEPLTRVVVQRHRLVALSLSGLTLAFGLILVWPALQGRPYLDDDFGQFRPQASPAVRLDEDLEERMGARLRSLKVVLRDEDASRLLDRTDRIKDALHDLEDLALVQAVTDLVPPPSRQRHILRELEQIRRADADLLDPDRVSRTLIAALGEASGRPPGPHFLEAVARTRAAVSVHDGLEPEKLLDSPLAPVLRRFLRQGLGENGRTFSSVVFVNPRSQVDPDLALDLVERTLVKVDPQARVVGMKALGRLIKSQVRRDLLLTTSLAFIGVLVCLVLAFRRPVLVALTTVPLLAGLIWTLGLLLTTTGRPFSLVGVSVIPLILGIGIDDGIHIVHRFRMHRGEGLVGIFHHTGRAIAITSLTTIAGFGALTLAGYRGLRDTGIMAALGIAACLLTSVVFLPALLTAVSRRRREGDPS